MKILKEFFGKTKTDEELKAEIYSDGYGGYILKKYVQNELLSETNYNEFSLNTLETIAENWLKGI